LSSGELQFEDAARQSEASDSGAAETDTAVVADAAPEAAEVDV
jgi:hypothetical protein